MHVLDIPDDMVLDLGYRKLALKAGSRPYPVEIAEHPRMAQYRVEDEAAPELAADETPLAPPAPKGKAGDA